MTELKRFCPSLNAIKLHSSDPEERKRLVGALNAGTHDFDVVVTTYEMAKSPNVHNQLAARSWWRYLVVDEGHVLKNESSLISQAVRRFHFALSLPLGCLSFKLGFRLSSLRFALRLGLSEFSVALGARLKSFSLLICLRLRSIRLTLRSRESRLGRLKFALGL
jgi:hypothetical protein